MRVLCRYIPDMFTFELNSTSGSKHVVSIDDVADMALWYTGDHTIDMMWEPDSIYKLREFEPTDIVDVYRSKAWGILDNILKGQEFDTIEYNSKVMEFKKEE